MISIWINRGWLRHVFISYHQCLLFHHLVVFLITLVVSLCCCPSLFSFILPFYWRCISAEWGRVVGTEELHSGLSFHLSTSGFQSQRGALKADSGTSLLPLHTKAERTQLKCENLPFLFMLSSPFHRYILFGARQHEAIFLFKEMADKNKWGGEHLESPWGIAMCIKRLFFIQNIY